MYAHAHDWRELGCMLKNMADCSEELLCRPSEEDETFEKTQARSGCSYTNMCGRFRLRERDYVTQYAHIYFSRLEKMRPYLEEAAAEKWGKSQLLCLI